MKLLSRLALVAAFVAPSLARAQDETYQLTVSGGADVVSQYVFRGAIQENAGFIVQPYLTLGTTLVTNDDYSVGLTLNTWNSIHTENTGSTDSPDSWYENDLYIEAPITVGSFTVTPVWYWYLSPNGAFKTIQEAGVTVEFDDTGMWTGLGLGEEFAVTPYVGVFYETSDKNGSQDGYLELGITPGYTFKAGDVEIPLSVPLVLGLSFDDYFVDSDGDNEFVGYAQIGLETAIAIPFPEGYGSWSLNLGGYYQYLFADNLQELNSDSEHVFWAKAGISFEF